MEGRIAIATNAGWNAMDAGVRMACGTDADGKGVPAWRPSGRCQVLWVDDPRDDGDNKARSLRGEHAISL
jgi:hypothetical protein